MLRPVGLTPHAGASPGPAMGNLCRFDMNADWFINPIDIMSNALTTLVPVLDGSNWTAFSEAIQAYLMSQGQWYAVAEEAPTAPGDISSDQERAEFRAWKEDNGRAMGNISLRCSPSIRQYLKNASTARAMWQTLTAEFGKPGMAAIFAEFKAAMDLTIPAGQNPQPAVQRLNEHFERLAAYEVKIPSFVHGMLLASKAPAYADFVVQILSQTEGVDKIDPKAFGQAIVNAWEQRQGRRRDVANAARVTAVKRKKGDPSFQQQQQQPQQQRSQRQRQQQQRDGDKKTRRGKRGGKARRENEHAHLALAASALTAPQPSLESRIEGYRSIEPDDSQYPRFKRAMELNKELGIPTSFERIRVLEEVLEQAESSRSSKRAKSAGIDEQVDWALEAEEPDPQADDAVSLGGNSDYEDDLLASIGYYGRSVPLHTPDRCAIADSICLGTVTSSERDYIAVCTSPMDNTLCVHRKNWSACARYKGKRPESQSTEWMLDSGASAHFTFERSELVNYQPIRHHVHTANGVATVSGKGDATIRYARVDGTHGRFVLRNVLYMPDLKERLLSLGQLLVNESMTVSGHAGAITLHHQNGKDKFVFWPTGEGSTIYTLVSAPQLNPMVFITYDVAHRRFAHPGDQVLRRFKGHTMGAPDFEVNSPTNPCKGCAQGKMPLRPFPASDRRATKPFELVHSDLKSFPVDSYNRHKYAIIFLDDHTSHAWVVLLRQKNQAISATREFFAMVDTQYRTKVQQWMSDAGGEYKSDAFDLMLRERGIRILQSAPHTPQQNGRAERFMRTMMDKAEAMRHTACIPPSWWSFAIEHAVHVYNRTPMRRHKWRTPFEALNGDKPSVERLRVFGCGAYVHIPAETRANKLAPKSELMTYIGNTDHGWKFMRAPNNVVFISSQAVFDENAFPKCPVTQHRPERHRTAAPPATTDHQSPTGPGGDDDDAMPPRPPYSFPKEPERRPDEGPDAPHRRGPSSPPAASGDHQEGPANLPPLRRSTRERKPVQRPGNVYGESRRPQDIVRDTDSLRQWKRNVGLAPESSRSRPRATPQNEQVPEPSSSSPAPAYDPVPSDIRSPVSGDDSGAPPPPDAPSDAGLAQLCREGGVAFINYLVSKAIAPDVPKSNPREWTYRDILRLPKAEQHDWKLAALEELEALKKRKVFELVPRPKGRRVIKNRWVFDVKTDGRKKARLVARGFSQVEGVDFDQIFSPVVRFETVRLVLALSALEDWHLTGLDVRNAYLYGELEEEIYMEQPDGFIAKGQEHMVLRLLKALYGLKQAGLVWWRTLDRSMKELGFIRLKSDAGVFIKRDGNDRIVVVVYVDDAIFAGSNKSKVLQAKESFMRKWECRDLGDAKEFLRMRILKHGSKVSLDQCAYLDKVLERCNMQSCKPASTPLPQSYNPIKHEGPVDTARRTRFQTVIGSLLYLMLGTRPDIAFAVTKLAQHSANPSEDHLEKALYICRYLQGTRDYKLEFDGSSGLGLVAFSDSDWGSDLNDRRSQTGYILKLAGGVFSWNSRAQRSVASSSMDAEYMALSDCSRQVIWVRTLLTELGYQLASIPVCCDNQGAIFVSSNPVTERRSKHIDIRYHFIRDVIEQGLIQVYYIPGEDNPADLFTKNLGRVKFNKFKQQLGLTFAA